MEGARQEVGSPISPFLFTCINGMSYTNFPALMRRRKAVESVASWITLVKRRICRRRLWRSPDLRGWYSSPERTLRPERSFCTITATDPRKVSKRILGWLCEEQEQDIIININGILAKISPILYYYSLNYHYCSRPKYPDFYILSQFSCLRKWKELKCFNKPNSFKSPTKWTVKYHKIGWRY